MDEQDCNIQIVVVEAMVEVSQTKEGLYVFKLLRFRPFVNDLDLIFIHCQDFSLQDVAKEFYWVLVPFTFVHFGEEAIVVKSLKYLLDVFLYWTGSSE